MVPSAVLPQDMRFLGAPLLGMTFLYQSLELVRGKNRAHEISYMRESERYSNGIPGSPSQVSKLGSFRSLEYQPTVDAGAFQ